MMARLLPGWTGTNQLLVYASIVKGVFEDG